MLVFLLFNLYLISCHPAEHLYPFLIVGLILSVLSRGITISSTNNPSFISSLPILKLLLPLSVAGTSEAKFDSSGVGWLCLIPDRKRNAPKFLYAVLFAAVFVT